MLSPPVRQQSIQVVLSAEPLDIHHGCRASGMHELHCWPNQPDRPLTPGPPPAYLLQSKRTLRVGFVAGQHLPCIGDALYPTDRGNSFQRCLMIAASSTCRYPSTRFDWSNSARGTRVRPPPWVISSVHRDARGPPKRSARTDEPCTRLNPDIAFGPQRTQRTP